MNLRAEDRRVAVIIDDDPDIRELIELVLAQSGFETFSASNGADGVEAVREHQPIVITLDVSMPGMDGFATARRIREISDTYIIMLTALNEEIDVVEGLGSGADDYLVKPFRTRELRARVEAVLRRQRRTHEASDAGEVRDPSSVEPMTANGRANVSHPTNQPIHQPATIPTAPTAPTAPAAQVAPVVLQPAYAAQATPVAAPVDPHQPVQAGSPPAVQVTAVQAAPAEQVPDLPIGSSDPHRSDSDDIALNGVRVNRATRLVEMDGRKLSLTRSEFDLLATVLESGRRVRSKADLVLELRGESYVTDYYVTDADKRTVEVHMANLRRKLGDNSNTPRFIETVRGVGYRAAEPD